MRAPAGYFAVLAMAAALGASLSANAQQTITFDDLAPPGMVLRQCWDAIGIDAQERVYVGFTARRQDGREDFALFRYEPLSAQRHFLGTFMDVSQAAGNLAPGEEIPKGHTHLVAVEGKVYMASQGFHDLKGAIDALPSYRGSHLYGYSLSTGLLEELSRSLPGGVLTRNTGIVALTAVPGSTLLAGLAHPTSDIVLFDRAQGRVDRTVRGIPWRLGNPLSREIVATRQGKIFTYRGTEDPAQ